MANTIRNLYSNTAGNTPSSLGNGVIALNQADGKLFYRSSAGVVTALATGSGGATQVYEYATTANFPATGSAAQLVIATDTGRVYRWAGAAYIEIGPLGGAATDTRWDLFLPAAPTSVTAMSGDTQATLSWTAPTVAVPVTDYLVQYSSNSGSSWTAFSRSASTATSATVTGLTNGTSYVFRVAAVNGVGTGSYSSSSNSVTVGGDPYFSSVALLLRMDGTGNTFTDSSGTPKTITASGNATQSTAQSKFGGKSAYFAASGDYLSMSGVNVGTSDFTIEMWVKTASSVQYAQLIGNENASTNEGFSLLINNNSSTGGQIALYRGGLVVSTPSGDYSDDAWHHVAVSRSGTTVRLYVDGTLASTGTSSSSFSSTAPMYIAYNSQFPPRNMIGYIDDVRVSTVARYTGSTLTVPAAAFTNF